MAGPRELARILRGVSRSFHLTLRVAPRAVRSQLGVSYLFCRAADTIADTALLPPGRRLSLLKLYRAQFERGEPDPEAARALAVELTAAPSIPEERALIERLAECFQVYRGFAEGDRALVRRLVTTLTRGMEMDLESFPRPDPGPAGTGAGERDGRPESFPAPRALPDDEALDRYCYHVAGCVGEFWTDLAVAHLRALSGWDPGAMQAKGVRFGKGLQMTNVLRDLPRDLKQGRCYIPLTRLECAEVAIEELQGGGSQASPLPERLLPLLDDLLDLTLGHYRAGWEYTLAIPASAPRLRLACAWPLLIGLATLALLRARPRDLLAGRALKVGRPGVRSLLLASSLRVFSDRRLDALYRRLERHAVRV